MGSSGGGRVLGIAIAVASTMFGDSGIAGSSEWESIYLKVSVRIRACIVVQRSRISRLQDYGSNVCCVKRHPKLYGRDYLYIECVTQRPCVNGWIRWAIRFVHNAHNPCLISQVVNHCRPTVQSALCVTSHFGSYSFTLVSNHSPTVHERTTI